ncbi:MULTISPECIES: DUF5906 domain-containing protein [unclassified Duganella]|uniref:DUF5906 domain-containing protein n=2 Tax=Telluria group TaxID=2895353 RepID=UPI00088FD528|nr:MULTISPECIES: DUF5906 domain-containing protein [unclassified Duganella]SDH05591.1 hypothetical protein SAMN05216320_109131 [Duganella sp. OV458]SDK20543.1 hypothetical protein SAMN05428973_109151 [Duganella sp. OV510]
MATVNDVLAQMAAHLPALPPTPLDLNAKFKKFGKGKKSWYKLSEIKLDDGRFIIAGAFGRFQGRDPGTVKVEIGRASLSDADLAAIKRRQEEKQKQEEERRQHVAGLAAGRARRQWRQAKDATLVADHAYLVRKQIVGEYARVHEDGSLLVPARHYTRSGAELACVQKIAPDGEKRFNTGADMVGASCLLGAVSADVRQIGVAEGYASGQSVRMGCAGALPVMVTFSAGNLLPVARKLRADFPDAELIFFADDDWQLVQRYARDVLEEFDVVAPTIDGVDHVLQNPAGHDVTVRATWRKDATGTDYIEADVRSGRRFHIWKFENAGIASARAAAREVENARVVWPAFADRGENKWTDFNDLHVQESLDVARAQVMAAIENRPAADLPSPAPSHVECAPLAPAVAAADAPPAPSVENAEPEAIGLVPLEWALSHCALIQGSTDVWDSVNKLRMKSKAFVTMVGKESAKQWENSPQRRSISPRNLPATVRGVAATGGGAGDDSLLMMLERYTLLYGTKTVWDHDRRKIIGYDAMALSRGSNLAERWLEHSMRREIDLENLVFDPTQTVDLKTHINMFEGFPLKPKKDEQKAQLALELLYSLCASEPGRDELFQWVLRWLAYPLQHPGAKMQTALLFFGEKQGTGKSLFFEGIVKPIYGEYGATGGQNQLDSTYTVWRSQKLFVLFEEILSRQDKYSSIGLIKHMITGRTQPISQKFKDDRDEANHMNTVMLSNEFQAVPLEPHDRRFCVADVRAELDPELLKKIKAVLEDGLIEAFYAFLLEYPLGDFNPHTWPPMTAAKERVISFGRPDWEAFYLAWAAGELDAPYCSCLSNDLYLVYDRYCSRFGLRGQSLTKFAELMGNRLKKDRQWVTIGTKKKLLTVLHVPDQEGDDAKESLSKRCERFRDLADIKAPI